MYTKILVVEDLDTVAYGISMMLRQELGIQTVDTTEYCDKAYAKIEGAIKSGEPYELLITDLSFKKDHTPLQIRSGTELIAKLRQKGHALPIIICSVEEKPTMIKRFMQIDDVSAYVLKGRNGLKDLKKAVISVFQGQAFISSDVSQLNAGNGFFELEDYDVSLLSYLSNGFSQTEISSTFSKEGIAPSSLSSIEKRLNKLKDILKASNNVQLVANAKDLGLI